MNTARHLCSLLLLQLLFASFAARHTVSAAAQRAFDSPESVFQSGFESTCEIVPLGASHDIIGRDTTLRETVPHSVNVRLHPRLHHVPIRLPRVVQPPLDQEIIELNAEP